MPERDPPPTFAERCADEAPIYLWTALTMLFVIFVGSTPMWNPDLGFWIVAISVSLLVFSGVAWFLTVVVVGYWHRFKKQK